MIFEHSAVVLPSQPENDEAAKDLCSENSSKHILLPQTKDRLHVQCLPNLSSKCLGRFEQFLDAYHWPAVLQ